MPVKEFPTIAKLETFVPSAHASGGDYHRQGGDHWIIQGNISCPMHKYPDWRSSRAKWGIGILGSLFVKLTASDGTVGYATGFGGPPACWLIEEHYKRFVLGQDPRDTNKIWDQMYRASMFYGRKGLPMAALSVVDLAIWDLLGKIRNEPIYAMIGGRTKTEIPLYLTGPRPDKAKEMGFFGGKVALPHGPPDGDAGLRKNVAYLKEKRESVGPDYPLMVDCWMSLDVVSASKRAEPSERHGEPSLRQYLVQYGRVDCTSSSELGHRVHVLTPALHLKLVKKCEDAGIDINWWEECLHPDDFDGHKKLAEAFPHVKFTTGEHEYTKYGFRKLIEDRSVAILQPDVMWLGGLTELIRVAAQAAAYDIPVVPHGSGPYSFHAILSFPNSDFCEYIANSHDGTQVHPSFGDLFTNEILPVNGKVDLKDCGAGFGLELNPEAKLIPYAEFFKAEGGLGSQGEAAPEKMNK